MGIALSDDVKRLLDGPNFAHLASVHARRLAAGGTGMGTARG
jgi:hypothetical protein